eukprot:scaffold41266_cov28-Attheya_sp.AAC.1
MGGSRMDQNVVEMLLTREGVSIFVNTSCRDGPGRSGCARLYMSRLDPPIAPPQLPGVGCGVAAALGGAVGLGLAGGGGGIAGCPPRLRTKEGRLTCCANAIPGVFFTWLVMVRRSAREKS